MAKYYKKQIFLWLCFLLIGYAGFTQQIIKGIITDETGSPVPDVTISVLEQPEEKVFSGPDGRFSIKAANGQHLEIVSGQRYRKVVVGGLAMDLMLNSNDELVQLGLGISRTRAELTAAVGSVGAKELSRSSAINPANALFGRIPGLAVLENGGVSWNNSPDLFIRGVGTLGDASLLVLVDGFERPVSSLAINEIESVSILKDAAALAVYGQRGANGVLQVTTKRGSIGKFQANVSYEHGLTQAFRLPDFKNAFDYVQAVNQARKNDGLSPLYSQQEVDAYSNGSSSYLFPDVDWLGETLRKSGSLDNISANFRGGAKGVQYFTMLNFQTDKGLLGPVGENQGYKTQFGYTKFNFRTNFDIDLTAGTKFTVNLGGNLRETKTPGRSEGSEIMSALYSIPSAAFPVKMQSGVWGGSSIYNNNPVAQVSATGYGFNSTRELLADARIAQRLDIITRGLSAEMAVAFDNSATYLEGKTKQYQYEAIGVTRDPDTGTIIDTVQNLYGQNSELSYYSSLGSQWRHATFQGNLKYSKDWGINSIQSILLYQQDKLVRNNQFNTFIHELAALNVHYSRSGKYFADFSVSYSGTNVLPEGNRFGVFPALSVAWKLSDEKWFSDNNVFDDLKIRASWGMAGNDLIPQNIDQSKFEGAAGYFFTPNNVATGGYREARLGTPGLTFETSTKTNVGVDARIFGLLDVNLDVFYDKRKDILVSSGGLVSSVLGITPPLVNTGIVNNKGIEVGASFRRQAGAFKYNLGGQFSFVRNKIVAMGEPYQPYGYLNRTGRSYSQAFGLQAVGFFKDDADIVASPRQLFAEVRPGDIKYNDQNADGVINEYDEVSLGYSTLNPELYYSFSLDAEYKGFGLNALFQGVGNYTVYLNTPSVFWPLRGNTTITDYSDNSWTPEKAATANLPRLSTLENANNYRPNNIWYTNGSFLKLRLMEVYYSLPEQFISKWNFSAIKLYVRGANLFSRDNIKVVDPEAIGAVYPTLKTYSAGINIGF